MSKLPQIVLRIDDEYGHHIIRVAQYPENFKGEKWDYTIEGYSKRPENYQSAPDYFMPFTKEQAKIEFEKQGKAFGG